MTETYKDETTPVVSVDSSRLQPRRPGRELFPASWLRHRVRASYEDGSPKGGDLFGVLLKWCGTGLIVQANGSKNLLPWDRLTLWSWWRTRVSGLKRRLCRLEAVTGPDPCPECGFSLDAPVEYQVTWRDVEEPEPTMPEWCETCGEQLVYVAGWADLEPIGPGEGAS